MKWLEEARLRFNLSILNYTVTMNHVHLILAADDSSDNIAGGMQLAAGQIAREYNLDKERSGAFWEDRYHATAVDSENYLLNCMLYIDLNMVRAGVVKNPAEWAFSGFREIMGEKVDHPMIAMEAVLHNLSLSDVSLLRTTYAHLLRQKLQHLTPREPFWTESLAVGSEMYVKQYQAKMGSRGRRHEITEENKVRVLRDAEGEYKTQTPLEVAILSGKNEIAL